ncbi:YihY/virulence factor BrkB family protein [Aurantivibrio infirmus]
MVKQKVDSWLVQIDTWMWQAETERKTRLSKALWHAVRVGFAVIRDVLSGHITLHAMSLVFTTILSLVPFLALTFSVLVIFGITDTLEPILEQFAAPLGSAGLEYVEKILGFVNNIRSGALGVTALGLAIYTAISLVQKIERSFNEIWRVNQTRTFGQRFTNYLSIITFGPALVFAAQSLFVSSDIVKQLVEIQPLGWAYGILSRVMPYIVIMGLFTFLYVFIPNTKVKVKYALIGGVIAGLGWQTSVWGFTLFVKFSTTYTAIYSSWAVALFFIIWLNLSWLILLVGASVSFYAQHAHQITRSRRYLPSAVIDEYTGLNIVYRVAKQFDNDGGGASISEMESRLSVGPEVIQRITNKLISHKIVTVSIDGDQLLPARSLDKLPLTEVLAILRAPESSMPASLMTDAKVVKVMTQLTDSFDQTIKNKTVMDWIRENE